MTDKRLEALKHLWQKRLRIEDWDVKVTRSVMIDGNGHLYGQCSTRPAEGEAHIEIRTGLGDYEEEQTLVHELLHVRFPHLSFDVQAMQDELDLGIDIIATLLMKGRFK